MKNKILTIIRIIFNIFFIIAFTIPTYAVRNIEADVILEKDISTDNKINIALETSQSQSIASFNISLIVESTDIQAIKGVKMDWNSEILRDSELNEVTYSNRKINIYVVSKNELGNNSEGKRNIDIGTLTIETENKEHINVDIRTQKELVKIASIGHETATIINDIYTIVQLEIEPKVASGNQEGDNNSIDNNNSGENDTLNGSSSQTGNQSNNEIIGEDKGQFGSVTQGHVNKLDGDSEKVDDESRLDEKKETGNNEKNQESIAQEKLPKTGIRINNIVIFVIIVLGILILTTSIYIKTKSRRRRRSKH